MEFEAAFEIILSSRVAWVQEGPFFKASQLALLPDSIPVSLLLDLLPWPRPRYSKRMLDYLFCANNRQPGLSGIILAFNEFGSKLESQDSCGNNANITVNHSFKFRGDTQGAEDGSIEFWGVWTLRKGLLKWGCLQEDVETEVGFGDLKTWNSQMGAGF